jgi:predicted component of type VI protein secretion system
MQVVLYMFRADGERKSFSIARDMTVMGRREDCDFRIPLGDISRKHCRLMKEDGALKIEDLGSSNGTYVNGKRIHESDLQPGDTIQIGPVVFVLQVDGVPEEEELKPYQPEPIKKKKKSKSKDSSYGDEETVSMEEEEEPAPAAATEDGDFDPMSVLEGNVDSDIMPALPDSAIKDDVMVDMSDSGSDREA